MSVEELERTTITERSHLALQDDFLRAAVRFTTDRLKRNKQIVTTELGNWEEWREQGSQIRTHTIAHLDYYLKQFVDNVRAAGGHVYFAADGEEASAIALKIALEKEAKSIVKSKSMVSEEIHINKHLEEKGIEAVETDLGEYIIQLAGEMPSHIIIPSIHKNREQIKELFTAAGGEGLTLETKVLTAFARRTLRQKFLNAEIGMTGCNFGIAESGTVVLFTNEGNGRMVTTLPKTHIVMMGMERLIPSFADLEVMANLLPRSATGQKLTVYMSMINGPRRVEEVDGPDDLHIIILDNGRSSQLGDDEFQEVLNCIRCGACLNVCPVYRHIGGHAYGSVYPGPIGAVLTPLLNQSEEWQDLPYASSLCGACYEACPVKIPLHDMLVRLRQRNVENRRTKLRERLAFMGFRAAFSGQGRYRLAMNTARLMQKPLDKDGYIESTFGPLFGWTKSRHAPAMAAQPFRDRWANLERELQTKDHASERDQKGGDDQ